ncbi:MAG: hypothetical protein P4L84_33940 [Isosphaeraceae bacterium]|nr:hypothetical protein [Isosphaeraceae bacterium]
MDVKTRRSLHFDSLEDRVYLSVAHGTHARPSTLSGSLVIPLPAGGGSGGTLSIEGNGNVSPLGPVSALGTLTSNSHGGGGVVNLAGGDGGVVLNFHVTTPHGRNAKPQIRFTVNGGTGSFTNASGQGTATEAVGSSVNTVVLKLHGTLKTSS